MGASGSIAAAQSYTSLSLSAGSTPIVKQSGRSNLRIDADGAQRRPVTLNAGRTPAHRSSRHSFTFDEGPSPPAAAVTATSPSISNATSPSTTLAAKPSRVRSRADRRASLAVQATLEKINAVEVVAEVRFSGMESARRAMGSRKNSSVFDAAAAWSSVRSSIGARRPSFNAMNQLSALQAQWSALTEEEQTEEFMVQIVETMLKGGEPLLAFDMLKASMMRLADFRKRSRAADAAVAPPSASVAICHARVLMAVGSMAEAVMILNSLFDRGERTEVLLTLLGKAQKAIAVTLPSEARATAYARSEAFYGMCFTAAKRRGDDDAAFYNGINVAHGALMAGSVERAQETAREVVAICEAAATSHGVAVTRRRNLWLEATLGEAWVILGDVERARACYAEAIACEPTNFASHHTIWIQAELTARQVGMDDAAFATLRAPFAVARPSVAICCGAMLTEGNALGEREARETVQLFFDELGSGCRGCIGSGAPGCTLLFLEEAMRRGVPTTVVLPCPAEDYVQSVQAVRLVDGQRDDVWANRFRAVVANATKVYHAGSIGALHNPCACEYAHSVMAGIAQIKANELGGRLVPVAMRATKGLRSGNTVVDETARKSEGGLAIGHEHAPPQVRCPPATIVEMWESHGWTVRSLRAPALRRSRRKSGLLAQTINTLPTMRSGEGSDEGSDNGGDDAELDAVSDAGVEELGGGAQQRGGAEAKDGGEGAKRRFTAQFNSDDLMRESKARQRRTRTPSPVMLQTPSVMLSPLAGASTASLLENGDTAQHRPMVGFLFADAVGFSKLKEVHMVSFIDHFMGAVSALGTYVARSLLCTQLFARRRTLIHPHPRPSHYHSPPIPSQADSTEKRDRPIVLNTWGDGIFMCFDSVRACGLFALRLSTGVVYEQWELLGLPENTNIRVGVHAGPAIQLRDPLTGRSNFVGAHVSYAARIEPITPKGSVFASMQFAALAELEGSSCVDTFKCRYVGNVSMAKSFGVFPTFHLYSSNEDNSHEIVNFWRNAVLARRAKGRLHRAMLDTK